MRTLELDEAGRYILEFSKSDCLVSKMSNGCACTEEKELYDVVIIAAPQTTDKAPIDIKGVHDEEIEANFTFPGHYHRTVATLVHGDLNPAYVGCSSSDCTTEAYFYVDPEHNINSVAKLVNIFSRNTI